MPPATRAMVFLPAARNKQKRPDRNLCRVVLVENTGPILITVTLLQSMHGALLGELNPHSFGLNEKSTTRFRVVLFVLVEITGIEPVTSCMPCKRSPS